MVKGWFVTRKVFEAFVEEEDLLFGQDGRTRWIQTKMKPLKRIESTVPWFLRQDGMLHRCEGDSELRTRFINFILNHRRQNHT